MSKPKLTQKEKDVARKRLYKKYGKFCMLCKRPESSFKRRLCIDHDHRSGKVRGLLCLYDNHYVVGRLTLENARRVYEYLALFE